MALKGILNIETRVTDGAYIVEIEGERSPIVVDRWEYRDRGHDLIWLVEEKLAERRKNQLFKEGRHDAWKK